MSARPAEGDIIEPMAENLLAAGQWLKYAGDCVYATNYWYQASQDPTGSYRFLTTPETFCIVAFNKPVDGFRRRRREWDRASYSKGGHD
ncbi:hypothetical protein JVU11DRAFT_7589 [Chiua virens]|nr:hypothetical protein JVU11DRAFT_7589 [Chiua virens]